MPVWQGSDASTGYSLSNRAYRLFVSRPHDVSEFVFIPQAKSVRHQNFGEIRTCMCNSECAVLSCVSPGGCAAYWLNQRCELSTSN